MLAAVLFTDIVGSTERATELGDRGWRDILSRHHDGRRRPHRGGHRAVRPLRRRAGNGIRPGFSLPDRGGRIGPAPRATSVVPVESSLKRRQGSVKPLSVCWPQSLNLKSDPVVRSFTVLDTSTSPAPAMAITLAPMCTAIPPTLSPISDTSPMWTPARIWMPSGASASITARAQ